MKLNRTAAAAALAAGTLGSLWLGSPESYQLYVDAVESLQKLEAQGPEALKLKAMEVRGSRAGVDMEVPPLYEVKDGVGIFRISGPLVTGSAGWLQLFGIVGYDDIRAAAQELMSQKNVKSVLLHMGSPGGSAAGCDDCAQALKALGAAKPMVTFTDSMMASGGYWLGSSGAKKILASQTAVLGSVGVIVTHTEYSKAYEKEGITKTVIRAGEHKQLANSNEPLSDEGKAHLKAFAEQMYDIFADSIAANLKVSREKFDKTMGRGREFMGVKAVDAGLAHGIATFDEAFAMAKAVDSGQLSRDNSRQSKGTHMKASLSAVYLAMLAGGMAATKLDLTKAEATMEGVAPDGEAQTFLQAQAITVEAALKDGREKAVAEATKPLTDKVTELQASLATANTELGALRTTSGALTEKVGSLEKAVEASEKVLRGSIANMCLALGSADTSADLKGADLVKAHEKVEADFTARFPGGRVSAATGAPTNSKGAAQPGTVPMFARLAAERQAA